MVISHAKHISSFPFYRNAVIEEGEPEEQWVVFVHLKHSNFEAELGAGADVRASELDSQR